MNKGLWTASLFLLVIGLGCIVARLVLQMIFSERAQLKGHTTARVVDLQLREDPAAGNRQFRHCFYPVFEYYAGGRLYKQVYPVGSYPSRWKVNDEIRLDYDPEDPNIYELSTWSMQRILPPALSVFGVILVLTACVIFLRFATRG